MPRSAGTYTLPVPPFTAGQVVSAASNNSNFSDIASALTGSVPRDGTGAMQADLPIGGYKVTGMANGTATTDAAAFGQIGEVLIERRLLAGGETTVDFALPAGFSSYRLIGGPVYSATTGLSLALRVSRNGGSSYDAGASDYGVAYSFQSNTLNATALAVSFIPVTEAAGAVNAPAGFTAFLVPGDAAFGFRAWGTSVGLNIAGTQQSVGSFGGGRSTAGRATNVRVLPSVALGFGGFLTLVGVRS